MPGRAFRDKADFALTKEKAIAAAKAMPFIADLWRRWPPFGDGHVLHTKGERRGECAGRNKILLTIFCHLIR